MKHYLIIFVLFVTSLFAQAQKTMTLEEFLAVVKTYHPVAREAALSVDIARAGITSARGAFDPVFSNDIARKELGGLLYYDDKVTEVKIPTWYGLDIVGGVQSLKGDRTSTPETLGNSGYFGFSMPVAKGLLMDGRRAALQQAKIFQQLSVQEQRAVINNLLYEAAKSYWNWWQQYQTQILFQQAIEIASQRFNLVKTAYRLGDRPAIDTTEALAQLQGIQLREAEIQLGVTNALVETNVFLWQQGNQPFAMPEGVIPQGSSKSSLEAMQRDMLMQQIDIHPELEQYRFKLDALGVEKRLKFQSLLPSVYVKYNQLTKSHDLFKTVSTPWLQDNYRYGLAINVPLRLSEGRGEYRKAKLKIEQTELQRVNKQIGLRAKLQQSYNEWQNLRRQISLQQAAVQSYAALQRGEEIKFNNGESSLFLVNARELKTLEARQKLIELQGKEQKAVAGTLWSAGVLGERN